MMNGTIDVGREDKASKIAPKLVQNIRRMDERLVDIVQEKPVVALCAAAAVGYIIGRIVTRLR